MTMASSRAADNGEDGEFLGTTETYDIIILDLGLPRMSGIEVLKCWREQSVVRLNYMPPSTSAASASTNKRTAMV